MTKYTTQERARYWPITPELMAQYKDGTHTGKNNYGSLEWQNKNGQVHRDGDKPAVIGAKINVDGTLMWYQNSKTHRDGDKPAVIWKDGSLEWFQNGQRHRFRGPAVIRQDGRLRWWINYEEITQEVNEWLDGEEWQGTPEQIFEFQLRFA